MRLNWKKQKPFCQIMTASISGLYNFVMLLYQILSSISIYLICKIFSSGLKSEYVMQVEWEKSSVQELDITATDLSTECLIDMLTRIPSLRFLSAGQLNGFNDSVLKNWIENGNPRNLVCKKQCPLIRTILD